MPTLKKVQAYPDSTGKLHANVEGWQRAELLAIFPPWEDGKGYTPEAIVNTLFAQSEGVVSILTTGPTSRPGARKRAGTTAPKRAAKRATEAQATAGFKAMRAEVDSTASAPKAAVVEQAA